MTDPPPAASPARAGAAPLGASYLLYYATVGAFGPFLALYLERRGFAPRDATLLLALLPLVRAVATPCWTLLADRLRAAAGVLRGVCAGALAAFALLALAPGRAALVALLVLYSALRAPVASLLDVLALGFVRRAGGDFGRLRAWGTGGYSLAVLGAGVLVERAGVDALVAVSSALLALTALSTAWLPGGAAPTRARLFAALALLAARPRFRRLVLTGALNQAGLAAYDHLFPSYMAGLSGASSAGAAVACGALAEVVFMTRVRLGAGSAACERLLVWAYAGSTVRWTIVSLVRTPVVLVPLQALHALTFGAYYLAAVHLVDDEAPPEIRASAQGLLAVLIWGVAAAAGLALASRLRAAGGMPRVFAVAAGLAAVATAWALVAERAARRDGADTP